MKHLKKLFVCSLALILGTISACNDAQSSASTNSSSSVTSSQSASSVVSSESTSSATSLITSSSAPTISSSSSSSSSSAAHVHDYGTLNNGYLPSYYYDGMKPYYYCVECGQYFDANKNPTTEAALKIAKAADEISFLLNGIEKDVFTLDEKTDNHVSWSIKGRNVSKGDTVAIAKPGDTNYLYGFFTDSSIDSNHKLTIEGYVNIMLEATPNGFYLSVVDANEIVVKVNETEYKLTKVNYLDNNVPTYIYGYHNFVAGDKMTVVDKVSNKVYDFDDLEDDVKWNKFDFHKGSNDEIVFDKSGRYGIEFSRGGNKLISVTKVFGPASEGTFEIDFTGERESEQLTALKLDDSSSEFATMMWYINHEAVINADDIREYLSTNDFYFYYSAVGLRENDEFQIRETTSSRLVNADHVTGVYAKREDVLTINNGNIKILKTGTYEVGYISSCDSIVIYEISEGIGDVIALIGGEMISLEKDSNNNVTYTFEASEYSSVTFLSNQYEYLPFTLAENYSSSVVMSYTSQGLQLLMILKACTLTFTYNLETHVLTLQWVLSVEPVYYYYLSVIGSFSGTSNQTLSMTKANGKATIKNVVLAANELLAVQAMDADTYESTAYTALSEDCTAGAVTLFSLGSSDYIQVLVAGTYDVSFDIQTGLVTITTSTN